MATPSASKTATASSTDAESECVECVSGKAQAEAKAAATSSANDGLQLGDCAPLYKRWAECVEKSGGQAKACRTEMTEFRACHADKLAAAAASSKP